MLCDPLAEYIAAAFTGIYIQSHEHADAIAEIGQLCRSRRWTLFIWDIDRGLQSGGVPVGRPPGGLPGGSAAAAPEAGLTDLSTAPLPPAADPLAAVRAMDSLLSAGAAAAAATPIAGEAADTAVPDGSILLVLPNFHRFLQSAELVQALAHRIQQGKTRRTFYVILSPVVQIPAELEKHFVILEHELPGRDALAPIAAGVATEPGELPEGKDLDRLLDAAAGLTRQEAEGAFALSLVRHGRLTAEVIWELKAQTLRKNGLLTLHRGGERFDDLGGLSALKTFCTQALAGASKKARPRGILLLGVPGTGKSAFAKALGNETGRPTLVLDVGSLMGSLVGQTEANVRQALRLADAMSPCILYCDELEKALAGAGGGQGDSGVSARLFGSLLTWLSDHTSDVFFVGTSNDVSKLPPEFSRAERFDGVFFLDLPGTDEKSAIWPLYRSRYGIAESDRRPEDRDWTGAEIASCCRLAALLGISLREAARHVVPVAATAGESVRTLRTWASGRCLSASQPGIYLQADGPSTSATGGNAGRKVSRASAN